MHRLRTSCHPAVALASVLLWLLTGCISTPRGAWNKYQPSPPLTADLARPARNLHVFDAAWDAVNALYFDPGFNSLDWCALRDRHRSAAEEAVDDEQLYRAINALLGELKDPHTIALSPRVVREQRTRRSVDLGISYGTIAGSPDKLIATQVWPGGSGAEAGVRSGWILESCDGQPARPFIEREALWDGQSVRCAFLDEEDQPCERALIARVRSRPPVREARTLAQGVVYLRFDEFNFGSLKWLMAQLHAHAKAPGIVLDLRLNRGGNARVLEYAAGGFLPRASNLGAVLGDGKPRPLRARRMWPVSVLISDLPYAPIYRGGLAILVSNVTSSASEIFASAIRYHQRGVLIGTKTAGAVLVSWRVPLPDGGRLMVSINDYRSPDGCRLEGIGVEPDIEVHPTYDQVRLGIDQGLEAALVALQKPLRGKIE